jgi:salicylate hydroxylase
MRAAMEAELSGNTTELASGSPNQWADKEKTIALFGYDADLEADKWWREHGEREIGGLADLSLSKL